MPPGFPEFRPTDGGRITVPSDICLSWFKSYAKNHGDDLWMVPLIWKTELAPLWPERRLDVWYLARPDALGEEWITNPTIVRNEAEASGNPRLAAVIYSAQIRHNKGWILTSGPLIRSLNVKSPIGLWVVPESDSISLWTDFAFQIWYGQQS